MPEGPPAGDPTASVSTSPAPATMPDIASLTERMTHLQALRVVFATLVVGSATLSTVGGRASWRDLVTYSAGYLAVAGAAEALRRTGRGRNLPIVAGMLLIDGVYLAWVIYSTGGTQSPLRFLVIVHIVAVTLLASYRTGLKIALWHSLLYFVAFYAQLSGQLAPANAIGPGRIRAFEERSAYVLLGFWVVAVATALFSALNERELRRNRHDLEGLAATARALEGAPGPAEVASALLDAVCERLGFSRGVVLRREDDGYALLGYRGPEPAGSTKPGADELAERASTQRHTLLVKRLDAGGNPVLDRLLPFARNVVVTPLVAKGQVLGVMVLENPRGGPPRIERRVVAMVERYAAHAALVLRNVRLLEDVQRLAVTDDLTGLPNRRAFLRALGRELARCERSGEQLSLVMLDIDHFKRLNDTYGHREGDAVLRSVAEAIARQARGFDLAARYGGEEFAVLLPGCRAEESQDVGDRLRRAVSEAEGPETITASAGVATFPLNASGREELIRASDDALYASKRAGRDRLTRSERRASPRPASPLRAGS